MKITLTQKEILTISRSTGMSFDFRMTKSGMLQYVAFGLSGENKQAADFAQAVVNADKQKSRNAKLSKLV